jgi:group I intron endonuclease
MSYTVYAATSPTHKTYVGITNNFKRRLKEHGSSPYPFGKALRKYGKDNFSFSFLTCKDVEEAYDIEEMLIGVDEVKSKWYYNISCGGRMDIQLAELNPMKRPEIVAKHPAMFTTENNPMNDPSIRENHNSHMKTPVKIEGTTYLGVRDAAKALNWSRQKLVYRLKSPNFKDFLYI